MLGWFLPKCPLATREKTWVEWRMRWLADQFGIDRLLRARVILPTEVAILGDALADEESIVGFAAADAMTTYGPAALAAEPQLLAAIAGFALTDYPRLESLVAALRAVCPDPIASVKQHFVGTDGEVRRLVLGVLKDQANSHRVGGEKSP
jgi:hypothetical protein